MAEWPYYIKIRGDMVGYICQFKQDPGEDWRLLSHGEVLKREDFPDLYEAFTRATDVPAYGSGENEGEFKLPDFRGCNRPT